MTRTLLCAAYLLVAISTAHSASFYFRVGREVVPVVDEIKIDSDLQKTVVIDGSIPVSSDEVAIPVAQLAAVEEKLIAEINEPAVKGLLVDEEKQPEENVVPLVEVSDEARAKANPSLRLDTLEVIQPGEKSVEKVATVVETVKKAAVQAIETQNAEDLANKVESEVKVVDPVVLPAEEAVKSVPVVEPVVPSVPVVESAVRSVPVVDAVAVAPLEPVVAEVKTSEPVVAVVENVVPSVEKVQESVRSADPEPVVVPTDAVKDEKVEVPNVAENSVVVPTDSAVRQAPAQPAQPPNPINQITNAINSFTSNLQNTLQNVFQNGLNIARPQSDATGEPLNTGEVIPAVTAAATQAASPAATTVSPNFLQNVISSFTNILQRPTSAPTVADVEPSPAIVSGTRVGDDSVEVVQHIAVDNVNDKIDLSKKTQ